MESVPRGWWVAGALVVVTCGVLLWQAVHRAGDVPMATEMRLLTPSSPSLRPPSAEDVGSREEASVAPPAQDPSVVSEEIVVHVVGAVKNPGVVRVPRGSRVDDAVRAAGGFSPQADPEGINLAQPLEDGVQVYVPRRGDKVQVEGRVGAVSAVPNSAHTQARSSEAPSGKLNINTASAEQLESLPGVGPVTARAIIEYRRQNGGFRSVDELIEVRGIGPKRLEQIRPYVFVR